ncbi:hypothetical protein V5T82_00820 [Magnetovibrio sp. PR-2]|uniref:hypothetical protein n=1 Tax=Magnetovibrio sp. PR-2 TaxID=3120356 RepID=UPI002FCE0626
MSVLLGVTAFVIFAPGRAQAVSFSCTLVNGTTVRLVQDVTLNNIAVARTTINGPVIVFNRTVLKKFSTQTQLFWLSHECAHQKLGHFTGQKAQARATKEQQADCQGAKDMVRRFRISSYDLRVITNEVSQVGRGRGGQAVNYMTGSKRAVFIRQCAVAAAGG